MTVCSDWIHDGLTITKQSKFNAVDQANSLLQTTSNNELHGCHVIPGTIVFSEGPIAAMRIECFNPCMVLSGFPGRGQGNT